MDTEIKNIGVLKLNKNIIISDPCCSLDIWCVLKQKIKPGEYEARLEIADCGNWGKRVSALIITHKDHPFTLSVEEIGEAWVDSGQCGFWDMAKYVRAKKNRELDFYDEVCDITLKRNGGVYENWGVVSETGYGDGSYSVFAGRNDENEIVSLEIRYINEEDEDEDYETDEDEE